MKMQSTTKHPKSHKQVTVEEMKDRISSLSNEILCHILSLLPTKYAVGTCILSTRWKYLWTSLPNLDFDDLLLFHGEETLSMSFASFASFVDRVLILHNVPYIRRFRLCLMYLDKNYECSINTWICAALWRNVQELNLSFRHIDSKVLPRGLFSCGTLVSLKLSGLFALDVPASVCLPKLKTLDLHCITFRDNDSTQMLFSSCPILEELHIWGCICEKGSVFNISALALMRLSIYQHRYRHDDEYKFIIDAPRLEYIALSGSVGEVSLVILSSDRGLPVFPNLTHLELGVCPSVDFGWELLPDLLQNSPNLESLLLCPMKGIKDFEWGKLVRVPHCLLHHLKTIEIRNFIGRKQDLKVVEYFLEAARVLQKLIIKESPLNCLKEELLLMFPRRSKKCEVVLFRSPYYLDFGLRSRAPIKIYREIL